MGYLYAIVMFSIAAVFVIYGETDIHDGFASLQVGFGFIMLMINDRKDKD